MSAFIRKEFVLDDGGAEVTVFLPWTPKGLKYRVRFDDPPKPPNTAEALTALLDWATMAETSWPTLEARKSHFTAFADRWKWSSAEERDEWLSARMAEVAEDAAST